MRSVWSINIYPVPRPWCTTALTAKVVAVRNALLIRRGSNRCVSLRFFLFYSFSPRRERLTKPLRKLISSFFHPASHPPSSVYWASLRVCLISSIPFAFLGAGLNWYVLIELFTLCSTRSALLCSVAKLLQRERSPTLDRLHEPLWSLCSAKPVWALRRRRYFCKVGPKWSNASIPWSKRYTSLFTSTSFRPFFCAMVTCLKVSG